MVVKRKMLRNLDISKNIRTLAVNDTKMVKLCNTFFSYYYCNFY